MELINILLIISFILNVYLLAKWFAHENFITEQQLKLRKLESILRDWQRTHSKCIEKCCVDSVLNDIINDM